MINSTGGLCSLFGVCSPPSKADSCEVESTFEFAPSAVLPILFALAWTTLLDEDFLRLLLSYGGEEFDRAFGVSKRAAFGLNSVYLAGGADGV